jgi:hypothetical protein
MLLELRGDYHLEMEEHYYKQALDTTKMISASLPKLEDSIGLFSPSGEQLHVGDMRDTDVVSNLISTGISDKYRVPSEIEAVGANMTTPSDHTFAMIKNYNGDEIPSGACAHTIGTNTAEVLSVAIVESTEQKDYPHQAQQFSVRPNVK